MRSALFLDLGGTILWLEGDQIYEDGVGRVQLLPGVAERLGAPGYDVVFVVTNQAGLERGTVTTERVRGWIDQINAACGGVVADYWAAPTLDSAFRKPRPDAVLALADKHFVDLGRSLLVGDSEGDRACAQAAGVRFEWAHDFFGWPR